MKDCAQDVKDMLLLLLSYFDKKEEILLHDFEETCLAKEVQTETLPVAQCIIVCGKLKIFFHSEEMYISKFIDA